MPEEVVKFGEELERRVKKEFGDKATPEFMNLLILGKGVYEHGFFDFIPKEKLMDWVDKMYEAGKNQRRIRNGEGQGDGMILINDGDVINAGAYLDLHGKQEGYLSNPK
jgi:hypothetical protein